MCGWNFSTMARNGNTGGRSGRSGRGGRGASGGRNSGPSQSSAPKKHKKTFDDYEFSLSSVNKASEFLSTKEFLVNYVAEKYPEGTRVAAYMEDGTEHDWSATEPGTPSPTETDAAKAEIEMLALTVEYTVEYGYWMKQKKDYNESKLKAFALLISKCSEAMKDRLRAMEKWSSEIKNDPYKTLEAIWSLSIDSRFKLLTICDALGEFVNLRQNKKESLDTYFGRFMVAKNILKTLNGGTLPFQFEGYVRQLPDWDDNDANEQTKCYKAASDHFETIVFMMAVDQDKYGSILHILSEQYSLGTDMYPKDVLSAYDLFSNHKFDATFNDKRKARTAQSVRDRAANATDDLQLQFAQFPSKEAARAAFRGRCYKCGKQGHKLHNCPKGEIPQDQWLINKTQQHLQSRSSTSAGFTAGADTGSTVGVYGTEPSNHSICCLYGG